MASVLVQYYQRRCIRILPRTDCVCV